MSWARFDDRYHDNRKIKRAWRGHPRAVGLHAMAVTYCAMHELDGVVDAEWIEDKLPNRAERRKVLAVLVGVGLFDERGDDSYDIHDFLDFNPSRVDADEVRAVKAERQRQWREKQRSTSTGEERSTSTNSTTNTTSVSAPTRPDPVNSSTATAVDSSSRPEIEEMCELFAMLANERTGSTRYRVTDRWRADMRRLVDRDGRTVQQVEAAIRWCHGSEFWGPVVLSPASLRKHYDSMRLQAQRGRGGAGSDKADRDRRRLEAAARAERAA